MSGFTKLWGEILTSSIWSQDDKTRIVWITILAMKDSEGMVKASLSGIAHMARVPVPDCEKALVILTDPDPDSRSPEMEGRRITRVDGGFKVVNSSKYRSKEGPNGRKDYMRNYMKKYRKAHVNPSKLSLTSVNPSKDSLTDVSTCKQIVNNFPDFPSENVNNGKQGVNGCKQMLTQAEAEADTEKKIGKQRVSPEPTFEELIEELRPQYPWVNFTVEITKMKNWLKTPKGKGKRLTRSRVTRWLGNVEPDLRFNGNGYEDPEDYKPRPI